MEIELLTWIKIGLWCVILTFIFITWKMLQSIYWSPLFRKWRRVAPLTMKDLKNRRKYRSLKETLCMRILKTVLLVTGSIFVTHMIVNITIAVLFTTRGEPVGPVLVKINDHITSGGLTRDMEELNEAKRQMLDEVKMQLATVKEEDYSGSENGMLESVEYKSLCLLRDLLEGKVTFSASPEEVAKAKEIVEKIADKLNKAKETYGADEQSASKKGQKKKKKKTEPET